VLRAYLVVAFALTLVAKEPLRRFPILTAGRGVGGLLAAGGLLVVVTAASVWLGRRSLPAAVRVLVIAANVYVLYLGYNIVLDGAHPGIVHPAAAVYPAEAADLDTTLVDG
jgi:hypothetical protein